MSDSSSRRSVLDDFDLISTPSPFDVLSPSPNPIDFNNNGADEDGQHRSLHRNLHQPNDNDDDDDEEKQRCAMVDEDESPLPLLTFSSVDPSTLEHDLLLITNNEEEAAIDTLYRRSRIPPYHHLPPLFTPHPFTSSFTHTSSSLPTISTFLPSTPPHLSSSLTLSPTPSHFQSSLAMARLWLTLHRFTPTTLRTLHSYTCSDLLHLTRSDANELLGVEEGIRLYHRLHSIGRGGVSRVDEDESSEEESEEDGEVPVVGTSPVLVRREGGGGVRRVRGGVMGWEVCCVMRCERRVRWRCTRVGCGRWLCAAHATKSLWSGNVYCGECYERPTMWQSRGCIIS